MRTLLQLALIVSVFAALVLALFVAWWIAVFAVLGAAAWLVLRRLIGSKPPSRGGTVVIQGEYRVEDEPDTQGRLHQEQGADRAGATHRGEDNRP